MIESSDLEKKMGIEIFFTDTSGIGGKLRKTPEDFMVEEISVPISKNEDGEYTLVKIRVRNWETNRLVRQLSRALGISRKYITFAGTKDRRAITTQWFAIKAPIEHVKGISLKDLDILEIYNSNRSIDLGDLIGNAFDITVRDAPHEESVIESLLKNTEEQLSSLGGFPNFFGHQRFGALRPITHLVGKELVRGNFEKAVMTYIATPIKGEPDEAHNARKFLEETLDFSEALKRYPDNLNFEKAMLNRLVKHPEDYIGALKALPKNLLMMFVHAYQSYLFNRILSMRIKEDLPPNELLEGDLILPTDKYGLPNHKRWILATERNLEKIKRKVEEGKAFISGAVYGSQTDLATGIQGEIEREVLSSENVHAEDFIVPELPVVSSKGIRREFVAPFKDFKYKIEKNDVKMSFTLNKGCYATSLLREFMKGDVLSY